MISDNFVTGDNIYLRELQNFFFEVLGMMSITHYGAVGDGRVDNYGPLQVAIDDAHRRGLSFLYVPYGRFIYTGELQHLEGLIFMGNPHAHIVNIRTGEEIKIYQFGWLGEWYFTKEQIEQLMTGNFSPIIHFGSYIDLSGSVGDTVDLTPINGKNKAYFIANIKAGETYDIVGDFTLVRIDSSTNEIMFKLTDVAPTYDDRIWFTANADGKLVISFQNTDQITPQVYHRYNYVLRSGDTMTGSLAIGENSVASGVKSLAQGEECIASGAASHAEGYYTRASSNGAHAEGAATRASGLRSHAEGSSAEASNFAAHAEGNDTEASGEDAHAEGYKTTASGNSSHAEGDQTEASNWYAHAEGHKTIASGMASHAAGQSTTATRFTQTAMGFGNIAESGGHDTYDATTSALVIGNGTEDPDTHEITPSNAFKVQFDGTGWFSGDVYVGSTSGTNKDSGSKKLISEADLQAFATLNNLQMPS